MMLVDKLMVIKESLDIPNEFGADLDNDDYSQIEDVCYRVLEDNDLSDFDYRTGASKAVFVSDNYDYVLKIPFSGYWRYVEERDEEGYLSDSKEEFVSYENAGYDSDWNYCESEESIYNNAVEYGVEQFFAATVFYGYTPTNYPVYTQPRVISYFDYEYDHEKTYTKEEITHASDIIANSRIQTGLRTEWIIDAIAAFGEDAVLKLISFIDLEGITDLHTSNYGYTLDGKPVIFDYAGWHEVVE